MVADKISNCELYYGLHPSMEKAFAFIRRYCEEPMEPGRYELEGDALYAMVVAYQPQPRESMQYESHDRYIFRARRQRSRSPMITRRISVFMPMMRKTDGSG